MKSPISDTFSDKLTPFLSFERQHWAALRKSVPLKLTEQDLKPLLGFNEELSLDDSISEYEKAIKLIKESEKLLEAGEGKVMKVLEKNGKVEMEEFE